MKNNCRVEPVKLEQIVDHHYNVAVGTVGFEKRSRHFFSTHRIDANTKIASGFTNRNVLSFSVNQEFFEGDGFSFHRHTVAEFGESFLEAVRGEDELPDLVEDSIVNVCVDISAMNRLRMAQVLEVLLNTKWRHPIAVDFVYCVAAYSPPPDEPSFIASAEPITPSFSGWSAEPDATSCAVFGVGYEPDRVVGTIEYIEPAFVWAFVPDGPDPRFAEKVKEVNKQLWRDIPERYMVHYKLDEPFNTFVSLESLVYSLLNQHHRPILIPFGPKLFTVQCLLAAIIHAPAVAVWRVSGGDLSDAEDRAAGGEIYSLRAIFEPPLEQTGKDC